jgi:multiple sugar transport system permease protein
LDGAGNLTIMTRIIFPLAITGMTSIASTDSSGAGTSPVLHDVGHGHCKTHPRSGLVMTFLGEASTNWNAMMSASIIATLPVMIVFIFLQRFFIAGLTNGAVKG